jgi:hypothetical protein
VERDEALRVLELSPDASTDAIRDAHRRLIRVAHPDAGGSARAASRVNEAFAVLRSAAPEAATPPPRPPPAPARPPLPDDVDQYYLVPGRSTGLLGRLAEAGHTVGEVVLIDPHVGMLEIVVGDAPAVGQLAVTVGEPTAAGTPVSFTLEPLGITPAPDIADVVSALMAALSD